MTAIMVEAALRSLLFALAVGIGLRLLRISNVPARKVAWSLVLLASLAMPFLMQWTASAAWADRLAFAVPLPLHRTAVQPAPTRPLPTVIPVSDPAQDVVPPTTRVEPVSTTISVAPEPTSTGIPAASQNNPRAVRNPLHRPPVTTMIAWAYLTVSGLLLLRLLWGVAIAIRLWTTAERVSPLVAPEPNVRASHRIPSPVTIGSGIVLPADYLQWDRARLRMVLAHERSHVRQLDFYLQLLAGVYTALFWFSPLGWWLRRTLTILGEAIGDRAGLDAASSRSRYAELLLEFAAMPRQALPGVAMARPGNLSHRIERMLNERLFHSAFAEGRRRAILSLLLIPAALFGATALIRVAKAQTAPPAPKATPPIAAQVPMAVSPADVLAVAPVDSAVPLAAPLAGVVPAPPAHLSGDQAAPQAPPPQPGAPQAPPALGDVQGGDEDLPVPVYNDAVRNYFAQAVGNYAYQFSNSGESYAIIEGPGTGSVTFSGDWNQDIRAQLEAARKVSKAPFLWFTHEGKSYIVTDPEVIARIRAMYKPMEELGRQQEQLGKQQEEFGKQQEELARQQEGVQVKMPDMSKELAELDAALAKAKLPQQQWNTKELAEAEANLKAAQDKMLTPEKMADLQEKLADAQAAWSNSMAEMQSQLAELQARLGALQGQAGARQSEFGSQMGFLGQRQGKLGAEQGRLGAEQGRLAQEADQKVRSIIDECLHNGKATQVPNVKN